LPISHFYILINILRRITLVNKEQIRQEKLRQLFDLLPLSIYANLVVGLIISISLWKKVQHLNLLIWLLLMILITLIRTVTIRFFRRSDDNATNRYYILFISQMVFSTLIWALSGFIIFSSDYTSNILITVSLLGIAVGGISSLSSDFKMGISFLSLLMAPFIFRLLLFQKESYNTIVILLVVFYFLMIFLGIRIHNLVFENILFKEKHKKSMEELTVSENKFRTIFEHAPIGIFYYNPEHIIFDCNEEFCTILEATKSNMIGFNIKHIADKRILPVITDAVSGTAGVYEGEYKTTHSHKKIWITVNCTPLIDVKRNITGAIGIVQNRTEMQLIEEKVRHLAYHDNLTGLPNRLLLKDRIGQAISLTIRQDYYGAILFLDLDNFKSINDSLGHHIGDKILKETALRIKGIVRAEDTVARIGGDEFVVVLPKLHNEPQSTIISANLVAGKIHKVLANPYNLIEKTLYTSTSIGIVIFSKEDKNLDDLLKNADTAMYEAKKEGRGCTHFYNKEMNAAMVKMLGMENNLRLAIKNNELHPFFQPIFDYTENTLVGAETLLRWRHPELGLVSPADFIPLAEETNLIIPIGEWLIEEVCRKLEEWNRLDKNPLSYVSINVSVNQLRQDNFTEIMIKNLEKYNIPPDMIVLEITENVLIGNFVKMSKTISELRKYGLHIALDDFGTGYSSLTYLKKLDLDIIKIDRAFIQDIINDKNDTALVDAILSIADNFQMKVIAEGVEELEQIQHLTQMGCRFFQGYYYSRPLPLFEFETLLTK